MRINANLLLALLAASTFLNAAASSASANHFAVLESERGFKSTYPQRTIILNSFAVVRCAYTVEGTFHARTFTKTTATLVGMVTRAIIERCTGGDWIVQREHLPWHRVYASFGGALPAITSISFNSIGETSVIEVFGFKCLLRTTAANPITSREVVSAGEEPALRTVGAEEASGTIPLTSGGGFGCPEPTGVESSSNGVVTQLGSTHTEGIKLI